MTQYFIFAVSFFLRSVLNVVEFVCYLGAFEDDDVIHVEGDVNPVRDLDIIAEELRLKDEDTLLKNLEKLERTVVRGTDKKGKPEYVSFLCFEFLHTDTVNAKNRFQTVLSQSIKTQNNMTEMTDDRPRVMFYPTGK